LRDHQARDPGGVAMARTRTKRIRRRSRPIPHPRSAASSRSIVEVDEAAAARLLTQAVRGGADGAFVSDAANRFSRRKQNVRLLKPISGDGQNGFDLNRVAAACWPVAGFERTSSPHELRVLRSVIRRPKEMDIRAASRGVSRST